MSADQCRRVGYSFRPLDYKCEHNGNHDTPHLHQPAWILHQQDQAHTGGLVRSAFLHFLSSSYWFDCIPLLERNSLRVKGTAGREVRKKWCRPQCVVRFHSVCVCWSQCVTAAVHDCPPQALPPYYKLKIPEKTRFKICLSIIPVKSFDLQKFPPKNKKRDAGP